MNFIKITEASGQDYLINVGKIKYITVYSSGEGNRATLHLVDGRVNTMHTFEEINSALSWADSKTSTVIYPECAAKKTKP